jgi:hypothetical protein
MGRLVYEALEGNAARIADALQRAIDRAKRDAEAAHWQVIRETHDRLNRVVAQEPLCDACPLVGLSSLVCGGSASVQRDHDAAPADGKQTGLTEQLYARIMAEHGPSRDETIH